MEKKAKTEPNQIRQFAQQENKKVDVSLQQEEAKSRDDIKNQRKQQLNATKQKQQGTKSAIEKKREEVANKINDIYKRASEKVTKKLADLETQSMKRFDDGNAAATKEFDTNVKQQMDAFKDRRYSGFWGWAKRAKDWLLGMDDLPEVKAIFDNNRAAFVTAMDKLTASITEDNKKAIQECKDELTKARAEIKAFVDKLGPELKDVGLKAQEEMNGKLEALDQTVAKQEEELANKLKDKQQAAIKAIDEKIEKMKEEMSGALSKLGALLLLAAKKFFTWALEKFGFSLAEIESIINKGAAVLKAIFTQPIQFVKNLVNAAITGFKNFGKNFLKHLKDALFEWLTGSLEGLVLPAVWDFKGIIGIALQMVGITYQNMRRHLVVELGENVVVGLEKTFDLIKTLITEGPMAAWSQLKEMAGEMRDAFVEAVKDFIKTKIIEQAIQWIISIFVPGAGIIKAIVGIYDTIVFFIQKAKQIMQMLGNFLSSIGAIAAGNIGAAADAMENGLARGLSLVINFLAQLLHLNGITAKIREALNKIRAKVDGVMSKVAKWIATQARKILAPVTARVDQARAWGQQKIEQGKDWAKQRLERFAEWLGLKKKFKAADGHDHQIFFQMQGEKPVLMLASITDTALNRIDIALGKAKKPAEKEKLKDARKEVVKLNAKIEALMPPTAATTTSQQAAIDVHLNKIRDELIKCKIDEAQVPLTNVTYQKTGTKSSKVIAKPLTKFPGNTQGEPSTGGGGGPKPTGWLLAQKENKYIAQDWRRVHLVSHILHGPFVAWNVVPGRTKLNKDLEKFEHDTNDLLQKDEIVSYTVKVTYHGSGDILDAGGKKLGKKADYPSSILIVRETGKMTDGKISYTADPDGTKSFDKGTDPASLIIDKDLAYKNLRQFLKDRVDEVMVATKKDALKAHKVWTKPKWRKEVDDRINLYSNVKDAVTDEIITEEEGSELRAAIREYYESL
jgi:hypothetical protein